MKKTIRLLLVDDHPVVRKGLEFCLAPHTHLKIAGEASNGDEAVRKTRELFPDIILMDLEMPRMSGLTVTELLHKEIPQIKVLILSTHGSAEHVLRIVQSGACGWLFKGVSPLELVKAIETISTGGTFFSPEVAHAALNELVRQARTGSKLRLLSNREREVCAQIAEGHSSKEIAQVLGIGLRTVDTHRERLMRKLKISSVAGLTKFAMTEGLSVSRALTVGSRVNVPG